MVSEAGPPPGSRIDWGAIGLFALGVLSTWLAVTGLSPTFGSISAGASIVEFHPYDLIPAPLAVSLFALAAIALIPRKEGSSDRTRRDGDKVFRHRATRLFYVAGAGAVVAIVIVPVGQVVLNGILANKGYERCPPSDEVRRAPVRWHLPTGVCP